MFYYANYVKNGDLGKYQANFFPTSTVSLGRSISFSSIKNSQHKSYLKVLGIINNFLKIQM